MVLKKNSAKILKTWCFKYKIITITIYYIVINENINYNFTFDENSDKKICENIDIIKNLVKDDNHNDDSFIFCLRNAHSILKQQIK